ncbi:MAG TPA: hypothetical protein VGL49_08030 [Acidimicrobiales bacterium]
MVSRHVVLVNPISAGPTTATPSTTAPGSVVTIYGGPTATANLVGAHNDPSDFYGIGLVLVAIVVAIGVTRLLFRRRGDSSIAEGPR